MKRKTWAILSLTALGLAVTLICATVILIDPFQIYRRAKLCMPPLDKTTQVYANAGVARQYDYDSAIVGTSVTENFRPTRMDALLGGRFIKLCTSAGTAYNHALLMDLAFRTHDMRRIVYGLDVYSFTGHLDETGSEVPFYLYDDCLLNDVQYWLNRSVLGSFLPRCLRAWGTQQDDSVRDSMYCWAGQDEYGPAMLYSAVFAPPQSVRSADAFVQAAQANLNAHLLPYIEAHPETQFDIFFPPYSAAEWSNMASKGTLEAMLTLRGVCYDALCGYANVTVYDFSAREEWVTDIFNYKDTLHYGQWINDAITDAIAAGENIVTDRAQLDAATAQLRAWADALMQAGDWIFPIEPA
ncbi:MAG: hypothetical protein MR821_01885 [Clostridiales bacterium]|nr:hypothetical protein [Clostridiales bacterium]